MTFSNPIWLYGLFGLAVPIAIHMWSKKEGSIIKVGSLKHFPKSESRRSSSLHFNEWWLLFLRLLLITLLVFILADPVFLMRGPKNNNVVLISPDVFENNLVQRGLDTLDESTDVRLLLPGLPKRGQLFDSLMINLGYWAVAGEIDDLPQNQIMVITSSHFKQFKGRRRETNKEVQWVTIDTNESDSEVVSKQQTRSGLQLLKVATSPERTTFTRNRGQSGRYDLYARPDSLTIQLVYHRDFDYDRKYLEAAITAVGEYMDVTINLTSSVLSNFSGEYKSDWLVWLSNDTLPAEYAGKILKWQANEYADELLAKSQNAQLFYLTRRLSSSSAMDYRLAEELLGLLFPADAIFQKVTDLDQRQIDVTQIYDKSDSHELQERTSRVHANSYLWLALSILLIVERLLAMARKQ